MLMGSALAGDGSVLEPVKFAPPDTREASGSFTQNPPHVSPPATKTLPCKPNTAGFRWMREKLKSIFT